MLFPYNDVFGFEQLFHIWSWLNNSQLYDAHKWIHSGGKCSYSLIMLKLHFFVIFRCMTVFALAAATDHLWVCQGPSGNHRHLWWVEQLQKLAQPWHKYKLAILFKWAVDIIRAEWVIHWRFPIILSCFSQRLPFDWENFERISRLADLALKKEQLVSK